MDAKHKLARWMEMQRITQAQAAEELGTGQSTVSKWLSGKTIPRWSVMLRLEKWTDGFVRISDWAPAEYQQREVKRGELEALN